MVWKGHERGWRQVHVVRRAAQRRAVARAHARGSLTVCVTGVGGARKGKALCCHRGGRRGGRYGQRRGKRHAAHEEAERAREEYDQAFAAARQALSGEEGHAALLKARDEAHAHIENARAKAAKAEAERAEKEQPYAADSLFMYLWQRQYGTAAYAATGITRMLDGWVARLIGYGEARVNFAALTEIPKRLTQYVGRLEESATRAEAAIEANVHEAVTRKAGRDLSAGIAALEQRLAEVEDCVDCHERAAKIGAGARACKGEQASRADL